MPCVMTLVFSVDRGCASLARSPCAAATTFSRRLRHVVRRDDRQPRLGEDLAAEVLVGALHAHDQRHLERRPAFAAATTPSAIVSHFMMPPKMLTRIAFSFGLLQHDLERLGDLLGRRAAADVEEVRGLAAVELDRVHRRHREAGAVHEAADVAVERDVREVELRRFDLGRILLVEVAHRDDVGMAEQRVGVEVELGVERDHLAVAGDDQRIDLGERRVGLDERAVERLQQSRAPAATLAVGNADLARDVVGLARR